MIKQAASNSSLHIISSLWPDLNLTECIWDASEWNIHSMNVQLANLRRLCGAITPWTRVSKECFPASYGVYTTVENWVFSWEQNTITITFLYQYIHYCHNKICVFVWPIEHQHGPPSHLNLSVLYLYIKYTLFASGISKVLIMSCCIL